MLRPSDFRARRSSQSQWECERKGSWRKVFDRNMSLCFGKQISSIIITSALFNHTYQRMEKAVGFYEHNGVTDPQASHQNICRHVSTSCQHFMDIVVSVDIRFWWNHVAKTHCSRCDRRWEALVTQIWIFHTYKDIPYDISWYSINSCYLILPHVLILICAFHSVV